MTIVQPAGLELKRLPANLPEQPQQRVGPFLADAVHTALLQNMVMGEHAAWLCCLQCCLLPHLEGEGSKHGVLLPTAKQPAALLAELPVAMDCRCGRWLQRLRARSNVSSSASKSLVHETT